MNKIPVIMKRLTGYRLFLPLFCLVLVLLSNLIKTPTFFDVTIKNGVLYGYIIDVINRASDLVILAVSAREAALLLAPSFSQIAASLAAVRYSPMIHVHSVYAREDVAHRLRAGGAWHPQVEHPFALGVEFVSAQLAHRAADDEVLLCARLGGMTQPERMGLDDAVLGLLLDSELDGLLGIQAAPLARHIHRQRHAFPHPDAALARARQQLPALGHARVLVASDWAAGAGPVAVLRHAMRLPEQARATLNGPQVLIEEA